MKKERMINRITLHAMFNYAIAFFDYDRYADIHIRWNQVNHFH